ncbi:MAG: hypothetical protein ACLTS6_22200 [Anaerobutyricum sp.]
MLILEEIRDINLGNESSATISIGIGVGRDTFVERYDLARAAIDLALGRGGDQAVVKSIDQEKFYGGKSVQIERNTRVKARVKAHALKELIEGKERVVVMGHSIGDVDSFGASIGIYRIAKTLNRKANVVLNEVSQSVKPIRDRFYTKEYEEDMIITGDEAKELVDENTATCHRGCKQGKLYGVSGTYRAGTVCCGYRSSQTGGGCNRQSSFVLY